MEKKNTFKSLRSLIATTAVMGLTTFATAFAESDGSNIPLANTAIGNQASLTYQTLGGESKYLQSNIVITTINQMYGVSLQPDRTVTVAAGKIATLNHYLMNTGNGTDSYTLVSSYDASKNVKIYLDTNNNGIIDSGESEVPKVNGTYTVSNLAAWTTVGLIVQVQTAAGDSPGPLTGTITATSVADATKFSLVNETINFTANANVSVYKALSASQYSSDIDRAITVYLKLYNDTPTDATLINLTDNLNTNFHYVSGSATWQALGTSTPLPISDNSSAIPGMTYTATTRTTDGGQDSINFTLASLSKNTAINAQGGILSFQVLVKAKTPVQALTNQATYTFNNGVTTINSMSNTVTYNVLKYVQATFTGDSRDSAQAGETIRYVNKFTNIANAPEVYNLSLNNQYFPTGTTFRMALQTVNSDNTVGVEQPVLDNNSDGTIDTGLVGINQTINVILYAHLPTTITNLDSNYTITKNARSTYTPSYNVTANDTLKTLYVATVDLTNNSSLNDNANAPGKGIGPELAPVTQLPLNPGTVGNLVLFVNNTSSYVTDTFRLEYSTTPDFSNRTLPTGVTVNFKDGTGALITTTDSILPLGNQRINAEVTVALNTVAQTVPLYFRVTSTATGAKDIKYDAVVVNAIRNVSITPNNTGTTYAGGNVVYTHTVQNSGNVLEGDGIASSINILTTNSLTQWTTEVFLDINGNGIFDALLDIPFRDFATIGGLKAGESVTIFTRVTAPIGAVAGAANVTTTTPNVTQGTYTPVPIVTYATDTTTVLAELLTITKKQKLSDAGIYTINPQVAEQGGTIYYMIEVKNTGTVNANNVVIQDAIPHFTTYSNAGSEAYYVLLNDDGTEGDKITAQTKPVNGGTGQVIAQVGVLGPNKTARLYFRVKINSMPDTPIYKD